MLHELPVLAALRRLYRTKDMESKEPHTCANRLSIVDDDDRLCGTHCAWHISRNCVWSADNVPLHVVCGAQMVLGTRALHGVRTIRGMYTSHGVRAPGHMQYVERTTRVYAPRRTHAMRVARNMQGARNT